jgi:nicotinamidase/pyrazinamidase
VVGVINYLLRLFDCVVFTKDWHPVNHCSFREQGGDWPKHCVMHTPGAELRKDLLRVRALDPIFIYKGIDPNQDAYSGFSGYPRLKRTLKELNVGEVYICGLATDYCVKATALDAKKAGFETLVILDACRGVDLQRGDIEKAIEVMKEVGIKFVSSVEI